MAEKLKNFNFDQASTLTTTEKAVYPWGDWFDGSIWKLTYGEDFETHPLMMERIIRTRATGRSAKVRLRHQPLNGDQWGVIVLQRTDPNSPVAQVAAAEQKAAKNQARNAKRAATMAAKKEAAEVKPSTTKTKPAVNKAPAVKTVAKTPSKRPQRKLASVS